VPTPVPTISNAYASTTPTVTLAAGDYCVVLSAGSSVVSDLFTARRSNSGFFRLDVHCT